jgi:hypothetical protein
MCIGQAKVLILAALLAAFGQAASAQALHVESRIPIGSVKGRIDHLALDEERGRLFVAELGNGTVGVVDLAQRKALAQIGGLSEPQGLAFVPATNKLYVASGGDGSVRIYSGDRFTLDDQINLGSDADNLRLEARSGQVFAGYGSGALAAIDPTTHKPGVRISLPAHPESFQFDPTGPLIYVNLPSAHQIAVVDSREGKQVASIGTGASFANFPMALDIKGRRLAVVFRAPPELRVYALADRSLVAKLRTCGDADDVFADARRNRIYVVCGEGVVDVIEPRASGYASLGHIATAPGARTGLWSEKMGRLFVAAPARDGTGAQVIVLKPAP